MSRKSAPTTYAFVVALVIYLAAAMAAMTLLAVTSSR